MLKKGLAKSLFNDLYQRIPWPLNQNIIDSRWPLLDNFFLQKRVAYVDYALVHQLLSKYPTVREEVAFFLCHLSLAAKEGHLCISIEEDQINPRVEQLWQDEEAHFLSENEAQILAQSILIGSKNIPSEILTNLQHNDERIPNTPICREGNRFYLQKHWIFESLFVKHLKRHLTTIPSPSFNSEHLNQDVQKLILDKTLLTEQARAITEGCLNPLTLVTGGPGTGKTYTAGHLIKIFWNSLNEDQKKSCQIVLAAPTGKAAANLQRSLGRVTSTLEGFPPIQAKTLHALLGIKQGHSDREKKPLSADFIVIDESSMIDVRLMASLFESLKPGSRLILLGDQHQLPSVEAGSLFVDLIQLQATSPDLNIQSVTLSVCMRSELKSLIDFAQLVNRGEVQEVLNELKSSSAHGVKQFDLISEKNETQGELIDHVISYFSQMIKHGQNPEEFLTTFQSIRLLSPLRKGPFGVEILNQLIWKKLSQKGLMNGWMPIPIIVTMNDYRQGLFNGETGVLMRKLPFQSTGSEDYALFPPMQEGEKPRSMCAMMLPRHEYAYCLSVHKSQGSEFDHVILVLPEGSEIFGREVFYTALTRARKSIEIFGSNSVISKTVKQKGSRLSGIEQRMVKDSHSFRKCAIIS